MANNKFCIECGYKLPRTAKFCEECGAKLIVSETEVNEDVEDIEEEVEERPSYLKKRGKYTPKPKETRGRTMQEATAEISRGYKEEEEKARQERLSSYETENSTKEKKPIFLKEDPTKTKKKERWYKHPLFIISVGYMVLSYLYQAGLLGNDVPNSNFQLGLIELLSGPVIFTIIYSIYKLIRKLINLRKTC